MSYNNTTIDQDLKALQNSAAGKLLNSFITGLKQPAMVEMTPAQKMLYERRFGQAPQPVAPVIETPTKTEIDPKLFPKAVEGGYSISPKVRQVLAEERLKSTPDPAPTPDPTLTSDTTPSGAKLDPNATEEYKTAFGAGEKKMDDMLKYFGSQNNGENLKIWAEANPALAWKEYKKAGMAGKEPFGYNDVEFGKLIENPAEAAKRAGIEKLYDGQVEQTEQEKAAQAFKNFYVDGLKGLNVGQYKDMDANSFSIDPSSLLEKSVDFNIPGLAGTLGNYGTSDYGELLKQYPNIFSYK